MTLDELETKLAAATGPSRKLDAEIACAFVFTDNRPAQPDDFGGKFGYSEGNIKCPSGFLMSDSYTASLDAAVALCERVLPGWLIHVWQDHRGNCALVNKPSPISRGSVDKVTEGVPSLALALCLAIVRALKAQEANP